MSYSDCHQHNLLNMFDYVVCIVLLIIHFQDHIAHADIRRAGSYA